MIDTLCESNINIAVEDYVLSENIYFGCDSVATDIVVDGELTSTSSETIEQFKLLKNCFH